MGKENCLINCPNHVISSMNRVIKIHLLIDYQFTLLKKYSVQLLNARSVRNKVYLIIKLIIDSNYSISAITETWLTINDSTLASQLTY